MITFPSIEAQTRSTQISDIKTTAATCHFHGRRGRGCVLHTGYARVCVRAGIRDHTGAAKSTRRHIRKFAAHARDTPSVTPIHVRLPTRSSEGTERARHGPPTLHTHLGAYERGSPPHQSSQCLLAARARVTPSMAPRLSFVWGKGAHAQTHTRPARQHAQETRPSHPTR